MVRQETNRAQFTCGCGGEIKIVDDEHVKHDCRAKYAPSGSYYTGVPRFIPYHRIQINPKLTNGQVRYNWWVEWQSRPRILPADIPYKA